MSESRIREITSRHNPNFRRWQSLTESGGMKKHRQFLITGKKIALEVLNDQPDLVTEVLFKHEEDLAPFSLPRNIEAFQVPGRLFNEVDLLGTKSPLFVGTLPFLKEWVPESKGLRVVLPLGDPTNLGAALRSCMAFGAQEVILTRESASPFHPKSFRSSSGAGLYLKLSQAPALSEVLEALKPEFESGRAAVLDQGGEPLDQFVRPSNFTLVVGQEGLGFSGKELSKYALSIPIRSEIESLNATIALSIALYSFQSKIKTL